MKPTCNYYLGNLSALPCRQAGEQADNDAKARNTLIVNKSHIDQLHVGSPRVLGATKK